MSNQPPSTRSILSLTDEARAQLETIARDGTSTWGRRAGIILAAAGPEAPGIAAIAASAGVSASTVRRWLPRFRSNGMAIFAEALAQEDSPALPPTPQAGGKGRSGPTARIHSREPITLKELCQRYSVDRAHATHVIGLARRLFDSTRTIHRLPAKAFRLLEAAALVHNLAYAIDSEQHHLVARDILLGQPLSDFSNAERRLLACVTVFHRGKVQPDEEPAFQALKPARRQQTLALTALLRIADGLDYSHSQTCTIVEVTVLADSVHLVVEGTYADLNGARAEKMADLWEELFGLPLVAREAVPADVVRRDIAWARLDPTLKMAEVARRLFEHYLVLVEQHADHVREKDDEWLVFLERDLARLEGVYRLFGEYFDAIALVGFKKDVRWLYKQVNNALTTRAMVMMTRAEDLAEIAPAAPDGELQAIVNAQQAVAKKAMRKLRKTLDGGRYRRFVAEMLGFSRRAGAGVFPGERSRAPVNTQAALLIWQEFAHLRSKAPTQENIQTQWRYVRRFHHVVHYLGYLLGPNVQEALAVLQPLEAQLRDVMLGEIALASLTQKPPSGQKQPEKGEAPEVVTSGLEALRHTQQAWLTDTRQQVEAGWRALQSESFRLALARAVAHP